MGACLIILSGGVYYFVVQLPTKQIAEAELKKVELLRSE